MKKLVILISGFLLLLTTYLWAGQAFNPFTNKPDLCATIEEEDGSPANTSCGKIKVSNGQLTNNGDGTYSLSVPSGGGGGADSFLTQINDLNTATQTSTLDFSSFFSGTESPAGEANITLAWLSSATATAGNLLVGNGTKFDAVATSGDISLASSGALTVQNDSVQADDIDFMNSSTTTSGNILIADGTGFNAIAMSGDVNIISTGAATIQANSVALTTDTTGGYAASTTEGGGATSLEADGLDALTEIAQGIKTAADDTSKLVVGTAGSTDDCAKWDSTGALVTAGAACGSGGGALVDLSDVNSSTQSNGRILVSDGTSWHSTTMGGSCTMAWPGTISCSGSATALIDLTDVNSSTATNGRLLLADGTNFHSAAAAGDISIVWPGTVTIATNAVGSAEIDFMNSSTTTRGAILVADGNGFNSLAVGSNNSVLTADSTAPFGVRYISNEAIVVDGTKYAQTTDGINLALAAGNYVFLPCGTYTSDGSAISLDNGQSLVGAGHCTLIQNSTGANNEIFSSTSKSGLFISNMRLDGNKANQTVAFAVMDFTSLSDSKITNMWITGGLRTGTFGVDASSDGEGISLRTSDHNTLENIFAYSNAYDGIKFRSSDYNTVNNVVCEDNGRACIQIAYQTDNTDCSDYNQFSNIVSHHSTGTPDASAPTTSGFYIHCGNHNSITGLNVYGNRQGIGITELATDNSFVGGVLKTNSVSAKAAIDIEEETSGTDCVRNLFEGFHISPLSGASMDVVEIDDGDNNRFIGNTFDIGAGSGTWVIDVQSDTSGNVFENNVFSSVSLSDSGTATRFLNNIGFKDGTVAVDADFYDLSAINASGTSEGLKLPQSTSCSSSTGDGQICWDSNDDTLQLGTGSTIKGLASKLTELSDVNSATATLGNILVGNGSKFDAVAVSSDITVTSTGAATISANAVGSAEIDFMNSSTTTAGRMLVADGTGFNSVDMSGSCTLLSTGAISCSGSATALIDLTDVNSSTATSGNLFMADGTGWHSVDPSGDVETAWNGTTTIQDDSVQGDDIDFIVSATATAGNLFIGEGSGFNVLTVGSNAQVLTVDTSIARKVKWATASGGGGATNVNLPIYSAKITGGYVVFTPPTADACTVGATIDAGDGNWRLLFPETTDACATWQFVMPTNYSSTPLLDIMFSMTSGEANEVEFEAAVMCYTPTTDTADIGTASFSNVAVGTATTVSATAGEAYLQTITLTDDSCAAGDVVFVVISTDANDATNDDATGNREVVGVNFRYTGS